MARRNTIEILITAKDKASPVLKGIGGNVQTLGKVALGGLGVLAGAAAAGGVALLKFAVDAAPLQGVTAAFEGITKSSGESADAMLAALQRGSAGMITQRDLMEKYNLAAQLVGTTFANQLPNAMDYLGKVAGATGEDMGYMMDSLVRGVGRLSPMILDNLGIQVNLTEANEAFADQLGITVAEMSKAQQQEALMAQVLEKLAENTAAMPDITGTAAQGIAALKASFIDMKDKVGLVVLPILEKFLDWAKEAAQKYLPPIIEGIETFANVVMAFLSGAPGDFPWEDILPPKLAEVAYGVAEAFEEIRDALGQGIKILQGGEGPFTALMEILDSFLPEETIDRLWEFYNIAQPIVESVVEWAKEFVSWKDVLIGLGVAIAAVVLPALWGIATAVAPVIAAGALLIGIIALVRSAWESNLGGIQEKVQVVFGFIGEQVAKVRAWFQENIPLIMETLALFREGGGALAEFWQEYVVPILDNVWNIIEIIIGTAIDNILDIITLAMKILTGDWKGAWETYRKIFANVWESIGKIATEGIEGVANLLGTITSNIVDTLERYWASFKGVVAETWQSVRNTATNIWESIKSSILAIVHSLFSWMGIDFDNFVCRWGIIWGNVRLIAEEIWDRIYTAISTKVEEICTNVTDKIYQIEQWWSETWDKIYSKLTEVWETIVSAVNTKMQEVYAAIEGPIEEIKQWILDQVSRFYEIGSDLIQGMIDGVGAMAGALANKISSMIEDVIAWVMDKLDIGSPSQVFFEIGEAIGQGLIEGIESMIAGVGGTMTDLVAALLGAASKLGGIGGFFAGLLEKGELADIRKELKWVGAEIEKLGPPARPLPGEGTPKEWAAYYEHLKKWKFLQLHKQNLLKREAELQAKIIALEEKRQRLAFLQQQLKLLDLIQEYGLDAEEILQGLTLGLDADIEDILDAMTRAIQAIIDQAEKELDISSPSKVFYNYGRMIMAGLAGGIEGGAVQPISSVGGVLAGMSRNVAYTTSNTFSMNVSTQAPVSAVIQDFEIMRALVGR